MKLILPKTFVSPEEIKCPIFFLAGPIKGGDNWQQACCLELQACFKNNPFCVVVPCRWQEGEMFYSQRMNGDDNLFKRQTDWEYYYLNLASERSKIDRGGIIFWLPSESKINPRTDGSAYARDSYGELAAWRVRSSMDKSIKLFLGADQEFPGLSVIKRNFELDFCSSFEISNTLKKTVQKAVESIIN